MIPVRGCIGARLQNTTISNATRKTLLPFSTSSDGFGRGRGRGAGGGASFPSFTEKAPGDPKSDTATPPPPPQIPPGSGRGASFSVIGESKSDPPGSGRGHGRASASGSPFSPPSGFPSFSSFMSSIKHQPSAGRGRGGGVIGNVTVTGPLPQPQPENENENANANDDSEPKKPTLDLDGVVSPTPTTEFEFSPLESDSSNEPQGVYNGMGRGKTMTQPDSDSSQQVNRHTRGRRSAAAPSQQQPILSREDAVKNALNFLSKDDASSTTERVGSSFSRGRGVRGRGRGLRGRGRGGRGDRDEDKESSAAVGLYTGDDVDGEKFAKKVGPEVMNQLTEAFDEVMDRVLPSPLWDEYVDAFGLNCAFEFEPEYAVNFENPDIDEKEPMTLREVLEKSKQFLVAYEGIQSQEEWEELVEETMARVPLMQKIVDHYSGPDRVTAKKQQEELERVAKTLPGSAPSSVHQFANRAVISLQSNPGWGFDKKCQFMDKLVMEKGGASDKRKIEEQKPKEQRFKANENKPVMTE